MFFVSTNFTIHSYIAHKSKNRKTIILSQILRSFNYALLFILIQQNTFTFFSYSIRYYNAMTSEIQRKDYPWGKSLGETLAGLFVTVDMQRSPGWNIFWDLINGGCEIRISWMENFLKINKRGWTSITDLGLGTLGASLFGNLLSGKGIVRAVYRNKEENGVIAKRQGWGIVRAGYGYEMDF